MSRGPLTVVGVDLRADVRLTTAGALAFFVCAIVVDAVLSIEGALALLQLKSIS